jgi:hypothetical protein
MMAHCKTVNFFKLSKNVDFDSDECHSDKSHSEERHSAECHSDECHCDECLGAVF